jgi:hypothetical protein
MEFIEPNNPNKLDKDIYPIIEKLPIPQSLGKVTSENLIIRGEGLSQVSPNSLEGIVPSLPQDVLQAYSAWHLDALVQNNLGWAAYNLQNHPGNKSDLSLYEQSTRAHYGEVDLRIVAEMFRKIRADIDEVKRERGTRGVVARRLENQLPVELESSQGQIQKPNHDLIRYLINTLEPYKEVISSFHIEEKEYNSAEIEKLFRNFLLALGSDEKDIDIRVKDLSSNRSIFTPKRLTLSIPARKNVDSKTSLQEDLAIMLGHHAVTAINGAHSQLQLLQIGLDGYISWHEGTSKVMWKVLVSMLNNHTITSEELGDIEVDYKYLAAALREGIDGIPRTYKQVASILSNVLLLKNLKNTSVTIPAAREKARAKAEKDAARASAGLPKSSKGVANNQALRYTNGYVQVLEHLMKTKEDFKPLLKYKINPSNPVHQAILKQYT